MSTHERNEVAAVLKLGIRADVVFKEPEGAPRIKQGQAIELHTASTDLAFCVLDAEAFHPSSGVVTAAAPLVIRALLSGTYRVGVHILLPGEDPPRFPAVQSRQAYSSAVMIVEKGDDFPTESDIHVTKMGAHVLLNPADPHYVKPGAAIRWHAREDSIRVRFPEGGVTDTEGTAELGSFWQTHAVSSTSGDLVRYRYGVWSPKDRRDGVHLQTAYTEFTVDVD